MKANPTPSRNQRAGHRDRSRSNRRRRSNRRSPSRRKESGRSNRRQKVRAPHRDRKKDDSPSDSEELSISGSASTPSDEADGSVESDCTITLTEKLSKEIRRVTEGRGEFGTFAKSERLLADRLFTLEGYYTVGSIRNMHGMRGNIALLTFVREDAIGNRLRRSG